jgi:hypothetical protein
MTITGFKTDVRSRPAHIARPTCSLKLHMPMHTTEHHVCLDGIHWVYMISLPGTRSRAIRRATLCDTTPAPNQHRSFHYQIISRALLTVRGVRYALGVLVQQPSLEPRLGLDPLLLSLRQRLIIDEQVDRVLLGIDDDLIAVLDQGDGPAMV